MARLAGGLALVALALLTSHRVAVWHDDVSVWADARETAPLKPRPTLNLAAALINRDAPGDLARAQALTDDGMALANARDGWEYRQGRSVAYAHQAVIWLRTGDRVHGLALLSSIADLSPQVRALCLQFHCRPDGDPVYGGTR